MIEAPDKTLCSCGARKGTVVDYSESKPNQYEKHSMSFCPHCDRLNHPPITVGMQPCIHCERLNKSKH